MSQPSPPTPRQQLWWCNIHHIVNDGYIASLSLLLPFIATDLGLSYTASGLLKTLNPPPQDTGTPHREIKFPISTLRRLEQGKKEAT